MSYITYPVGNLLTLRFYFSTVRALTATELAIFAAGGGLPSGVGTDVVEPLCDLAPPGEQRRTLKGSEVIHDAPGAYHTVVALTKEGLWRWRGRALDAFGEPAGAMPDQSFNAARSF